tara:strand:- start:3662 stop:5710 length:2049 start_codon:yes stop_codon:yes gene_type:complete
MARGYLGSLPEDGQISAETRPIAHLEGKTGKQIFFGDLHVHTTFSQDAFFFSLPMLQGEGVHPPSDACNFARFCSALDFFSITDHAEGLTKDMWNKTVQATKSCNSVSSDNHKDLIAFAGWEWTQMAGEAGNPEEHFGHKNVILKDLENIPSVPIGAGLTGMDYILKSKLTPPILLLADFPPEKIDMDFLAYRKETYSIPFCSDLSKEELNYKECKEAAATPKELFNRIDELNLEALVIPHGTAWGIHSPVNSSFLSQLELNQHDENKQRLFEVYSGHGNSEIYKDFRHYITDKNGNKVCPDPTEDFEPCCWRAGEIVKKQCELNKESLCDEKANEVKNEFVSRIKDISRFGIIKNSKPEDWLQCGQLKNEFLPAYTYRPLMSAQSSLASKVSSGDSIERFKLGLIGSSDNHKARAGAGYKEFARKAMGDSWGAKDNLTWLIPPERGASFYSTGGLVAVHAESLGREELFTSLYNREVYATSGERILLWFDMIHPKLGKIPMGSEVSSDKSELKFLVKAIGSFKQKPGCPEYVHNSLSKDEVSRLCLNECYNPSDKRNKINRIEVVKIIVTEDIDNLDEAINDPWKVFNCEDQGEGCSFEFIDSDLSSEEIDTVYYVRAIQEPSLAVGGDPLRCELNEKGECIKTRPCYASGDNFDAKDDCLSLIQERAWSSPIFISYKKSS